MRGAGGGFGGGATAELDPRRAAHLLVRAVRQVGVGQAEGIRASRSRLLAEYPSRGGGRRDRCPPRAPLCINTPTYGLYYSQHSYTQRGRQVDTVAPRDVRVLPKKRRVGGRTSHGLTLPGGIAYSYVYFLRATRRLNGVVARSMRGNLLYRGSHC